MTPFLQQIFNDMRGKVSAVDDAVKRSLASSCLCGAMLYCFRGRHSGKFLLRHEPHFACPHAGLWLSADSKADVVAKWKAIEPKETLPF